MLTVKEIVVIPHLSTVTTPQDDPFSLTELLFTNPRKSFFNDVYEAGQLSG